MNPAVLSDETLWSFAPRWASLAPASQVLLLGVLLLLPVVLILWLGRLERRLIRPWQAAGLLTLRLAIVCLLWFVVAFRPSLVHTQVEQLTGRVRVAVDLSGSMETRDPQRSLAEKIRLARALRLPAPDAELDEALVDTWLQPGQTPALSERQQGLVQAWLAGVDQLARRDVVERLLAPDGLDLLGRLGQQHRVEILGFDKVAHPGAIENWRDLFAVRSRRDPAMTDLRVPLGDTTARGEEPLLGIVLLTDGRHNTGAPPLELAEELGRQRTPIYAIAVGARQAPADLSVVELHAPAKVFKGGKVPVTARIRVTHLPAQELTVELQVEGKTREPEHRIVLKHDGTDRTYPAAFQLALDEGGPHNISVRVQASKGQPALAEHAQRSQIVLAGDEPARVLLVDGEARWEYHYLASSLGRDPLVQLDRVLFVQPRLGLLKEAQADKAGLPRRQLPAAPDKGPDPLEAFDCILLGDVAPEHLPAQERRRLEEYVARRGGTVVLVAGKRYLPLAYAQAPEASKDPLLKMLPILEPRAVQPVRGFHWKLSAEGLRTPFLNLDPEQPAEPWPRLPRHYWGVAGTRKPGATVLATAEGEDPNLGIVVQQSYGAGRVVYVGLDSTWRWRAESGDLHHHRFWGQLVLWAATEKLLPAGNRHVRYGTREPAYEPDQDVEVVVRLNENVPLPPGPLEARAQLVRRDGEAERAEAVVPLTVSAANGRVLEGKVRGLPGGAYGIRLDIPSLREQLADLPGDKERVRPLFHVRAADNREMAELATDWDLLQALAQNSKGELYSSDQAQEVLQRLARRVQRRELREESRPWQDAPLVWWSLGGLIALLTLEWGWRKWLDLP